MSQASFLQLISPHLDSDFTLNDLLCPATLSSPTFGSCQFSCLDDKQRHQQAQCIPSDLAVSWGITAV